LGWEELNLGNHAAARQMVQEGLDIYRQLADNHGISRSLNFLAHVACVAGDLERGRALWEEGLVFAREFDDQWTIGHILTNLGKVAEQQEEWGTARSLYRESLLLRDRLADKRGVVECLEGFAALAVREQRLKRAARLLGAATAWREAAGVPLLPGHDWQAGRADPAATVRAGLGEVAFAEAWAAGRAMSLERAMAEALGDA
jgi:non-specific serine/threonine protein kinase